MKKATKTQELRRWVKQWQRAGRALEEVKRDELAHLSEEQAWRQSEDLLSIPGGWRDPHAVCGLIEQQALFHRKQKR